MSVNKIYISLDNIVLCRIIIDIRELELNLKDFYNEINFQSFKNIANIKFNKINEDDFNISLKAKKIESTEESHESLGPEFYIDLTNKSIRFTGPPIFRNFDYKKVVDDMCIDGNNLIYNLHNIYKDPFNLEITTLLYFEISNKDSIKDFIELFTNLNNSCQNLDRLNGTVSGVSFEISKENGKVYLSFNKFENRNKKDQLIRVGFDAFAPKKQTKLVDFNLRKHISNNISMINDILNSIKS